MAGLSDGGESLLTFPTDFPIKVFGRNEAPFREAVHAIVSAHYGDAYKITEQLSKQGAYLSLTVTVRAESRARLDAVYQELVAHEHILMAL